MKVLLVISCLQVFAYSTSAQVIPHVRYTSKDGLISDRITAITQDEKGFMWFGSFFGICRYDGIKFQKISLPPQQQNKYVTFLLPANNKIYAGFLFQGGLAEFTGGKIISHFIRGKDSATSNEFTCSSNNNDGTILLSNTKGQIYQFANNSFKYLYTSRRSTSTHPSSIAKDKYNNLWIGTGNGLLIVPYPYTSEKIFFPAANIISITKNDAGKILFSRHDGINIITEASDGWQRGSLNQTLAASSSSVQPVLFSGNTSKGFWGVDYRKQLVNVLDKKESFYNIPFRLNTIVNIIFADRENNVWLANEPGVIKVTNQSVKTFYFDELAPGGSNVMQESDSVIWVTNSKFLYRISGNLFSKVPEFRFNNEGYISTINKDLHGNLWITYWDGGVSKMKWNGHRLVTLKSFKKAISGQLMMTGDTVWVIGTKGIFLIRNNVVIHHFHPNNRNGTPATISCFAMDEQQRQLWIGDNAEGIIKIDFADSSGRFTYSASEYITSENGLKDMAVRSLMLDKDKRLWIGTRFGGIYHLTKKGSSKSLVEDVTIKANMECTRTTQIAEEKGRAVWFATCNGIYRYINNGQQWEQYNTGIGLVNAEIFSIAVNEKNKRLWAAGAEGVSELKIGEKIQAIPPVVSLIDITILGKSDTSALFSKASMKYQSNQSSIGFVFAGASFIDEKQIKYKYMLQGYDKSWSEPVMTNNVNYASLPPGKYVFKVLAANVQNQWSSSPAMFQFEIVLPFYKRPWFIFALLLVSILVAYFIRVQQLKQRFNIEKLRLAIARDLHDDVGSTLGSINLLSKTATRRLDKNFSPDEIAPIFEKIGQSAEDTLEAMDDIVWSINPDKDKVEDLVIRMREFAIPLFESNNIEFNFVFDADNHKPLPMNLRRNAFLVFKEAIHNIIKHANASLITVRIRAEHDKFLMKISDNGKGFLANFSSPRNGIKNMHNRAKICHADLQISSSPAGTTINFVAPIV